MCDAWTAQHACTRVQLICFASSWSLIRTYQLAEPSAAFSFACTATRTSCCARLRASQTVVKELKHSDKACASAFRFSRVSMQSTLVSYNNQGKGANPKTTLYVGGLEENINEAILHSAFVPFGDVKDVNIPLDHATGKHRGFGFVEFEDKEDPNSAIDNMNNAELYGRVLRVNYAQPMKIKGGDKGWSHQAVWADTDDWYDRQAAEQELEKLDVEAKQKARAAETDKYTPKDPMQQIEEGLVAS